MAEKELNGGVPPADFANAARALQHNGHRALVHLAALTPLAWFALDALQDSSFDWGRELMLRTGSIGLMLLVASFACTPLNALFGWRQFLQVRRALGLYAFLYITLHLLTYTLYDSGFDLEIVVRDLSERRAMSVGLVAFLALIPLALTSTRGWQRRLGKNWRTLHKLVYLAVPLSVLHFLWLDRDWIELPLVYAALVGALFVLRLSGVRRFLRAAILGSRS